MKQFNYVITDPMGIHARPATMIYNVCMQVSSHVQIHYNNQIIDGSDVLSVMGLRAKQGETLLVMVNGEEEDRDFEKVKSTFDSLIQ